MFVLYNGTITQTETINFAPLLMVSPKIENLVTIYGNWKYWLPLLKNFIFWRYDHVYWATDIFKGILTICKKKKKSFLIIDVIVKSNDFKNPRRCLVRLPSIKKRSSNMLFFIREIKISSLLSHYTQFHLKSWCCFISKMQTERNQKKINKK